MYELQEKKRTRRFLYSWPVIVLLFASLLLLVHSVWGAYQKERYALEKSEESLRELREMQKHERELSAQMERLQSERGREEEIREKFLVGKEGEGVIYIIDTPAVAGSTHKKNEKENFWAGFLDFFR